MKLITALLVLFSNDPDLHSQMKEAIKTIESEDLKQNSFLCEETIRAMHRLKKRAKR